MAKVAVIQGEAKLLPFRIKNRATGQAMNLTAARFILWAKRSEDDDYVALMKTETDFDTSLAATGYVTVFLTADDTCLDPWIYTAELRITLNATPVPIEKIRFELEVLEAITPSNLTKAPTGIISLEAVGAPTVSRS
jgi:hypothetical protein